MRRAIIATFGMLFTLTMGTGQVLAHDQECQALFEHIVSEITVLEGDTAQVAGPGTIFIDQFGRPMPPGSVAGVDDLP